MALRTEDDPASVLTALPLWELLKEVEDDEHGRVLNMLECKAPSGALPSNDIECVERVKDAAFLY